MRSVADATALDPAGGSRGSSSMMSTFRRGLADPETHEVVGAPRGEHRQVDANGTIRSGDPRSGAEQQPLGDPLDLEELAAGELWAKMRTSVVGRDRPST